MLRTARVLAGSLALGVALFVLPAGAAPSAVAIGPLPECRLDDILTSPRDYDSWSTTLVDWILTVGPDYRPPDLVSVSAAGVTGGGQIRAVAFGDLEAMADAARRNGTPLGNVSAYRSYRTQKALFNSYVDGYGFRRAINFSARPGHSEHQLGLVLDFAEAGQSSFVSEASPAGHWLSKNAWKYGWLMSYPRGKKPVTCYSYEPWHYRYVGREMARKIHDAGVTIREYLWANYTTAQVPPVSPSPGAPAAPSLAPTPSPESSAEPTVPPTVPPATLAPATSAPSPVPTDAPGLSAATWFGLDPPIVIGVALTLVAIGTLATLGARRGARGR